MLRWMMAVLLLGMLQDDAPKASEGWVQLPADGETSASAFVVVRNPGMYDVYLVSGSSEVAAKVELRQGGDGADQGRA